mmetsp:Transcript_22555/g.55609  ORF Transcript_22555/g.55609 Transcript_22555/m.55609 type:complete len:201 (-) Transcript_22555:1350-1952(-)
MEGFLALGCVYLLCLGAFAAPLRDARQKAEVTTPPPEDTEARERLMDLTDKLGQLLEARGRQEQDEVVVPEQECPDVERRESGTATENTSGTYRWYAPVEDYMVFALDSRTTGANAALTVTFDGVTETSAAATDNTRDIYENAIAVRTGRETGSADWAVECDAACEWRLDIFQHTGLCDPQITVTLVDVDITSNPNLIII